MATFALGSAVGKQLVPNTGYNAANAAGANSTITQQDLLPQIATANGNVQGNISNQNSFAQALLAQSNGAGPNLAGAQLANATGQNVSNQAALMASQRGAGSNSGLIARQAAQQGAGIQQQAAGQAATNRLQQQLGTQQELAGVYGNIGQESGQNLATQQGALANQNSAIVGGTDSANKINSQIATNNTNNQMAALSGIGQGAEKAAMAEGGEVQREYSGELDDHLKHVSSIFHPHMLHNYAKGGKVPALVSPGEIYLKPDDVKKVESGKANPMQVGEVIPGKPKVPGSVNSYENDTVRKNLDVGGEIVPRSETQSNNPVKDSMKFVMETMNKKKRGAK